jgi:hydroxyethylthiazole kinase-like uncharacterized protein yjeF
MKRVVGSRTWALHESASCRLIEQEALATTAPHSLMRRAGLAVANLARALRPHGASCWVAAGPGNNGGDGMEAALRLVAAGWSVEVTLLADAASLPTDARDAFERACAAGVRFTSQRELGTPDLAIDALLGLGGRRPPEGSMADAVHDLNALPCLRLSVDLPSGLNADTGQAHGDTCVVADHTLSLLTLKPGLFTGNGRDHAGSVWLDDLGIDTRHSPDAWLGHRELTPSARRHAQHKGSFGDVAVVGGAEGMVGASLLAARAAHAAGAGRIYVDLLGASAPTHDIARPELMFRRGWSRSAPEAIRRSTVVCGCGGGDAVRTVLPRLLSLAGRLVLDADALNAIAVDPQLQAILRTRSALSTVLTPHPLEAARLLGIGTPEIQADRLAAARRLADRFSCVVVLKGSGTVIASPGETPSINPTGTAALATGGTGDVLAGWIGGEWSASGRDAPSVARDATWLHGHSADQVSIGPLRAADLIESMHRARMGAG